MCKFIPIYLKYEFKKYYFTNRVTHNSLPNSVVMADSINSFRPMFCWDNRTSSGHCMILYMIIELRHLPLEVQEIKFPYDRCY